MSQDGLGRVFNVIADASGVHIPLTRAEAVTFVVYETDGTTALTLKQSISGASEADLTVIDKLYRGPGVGGGWTKVSQAAAASYTATDATNDCVVFTVRGRELDEGYNAVECTDAGRVVAIIHDLAQQSDPEKLRSSLLA